MFKIVILGKKKILAVLNEQDEEGYVLCVHNQSCDSHMILIRVLFRCTPLHYSAAYNFLDFIEDFLELGSVVDVEDNKGYINRFITCNLF